MLKIIIDGEEKMVISEQYSKTLAALMEEANTRRQTCAYGRITVEFVPPTFDLALSEKHPMDGLPDPAPAVVQFEVGKEYWTRSICDHDCIYRFKILARTDKTVTITVHGKRVRRGLRIIDGAETFKPHGQYSMSATIWANKEWKGPPAGESWRAAQIG